MEKEGEVERYFDNLVKEEGNRFFLTDFKISISVEFSRWSLVSLFLIDEDLLGEGVRGREVLIRGGEGNKPISINFDPLLLILIDLVGVNKIFFISIVVVSNSPNSGKAVVVGGKSL